MKFSLNQDTAVMRAVRTLIQSLAGLALAIWAVPGVPQVVHNYLTSNLVTVAIAVGLPAGLVALVWNLFRKDVPNF